MKWGRVLHEQLLSLMLRNEYGKLLKDTEVEGKTLLTASGLGLTFTL